MRLRGGRSALVSSNTAAALIADCVPRRDACGQAVHSRTDSPTTYGRTSMACWASCCWLARAQAHGAAGQLE